MPVTAEEVAGLYVEYLDALHAGQGGPRLQLKRARAEAAALRWRVETKRRGSESSMQPQVGRDCGNRNENSRRTRQKAA